MRVPHGAPRRSAVGMRAAPNSGVDGVEIPLVEDVNDDEKMSELVRVLRARFLENPPEDYLPGKTDFRNVLMSHYRCSALKAETLVDRMEALGYLLFVPGEGPDDLGVWRFHDPTE